MLISQCFSVCKTLKHQKDPGCKSRGDAALFCCFQIQANVSVLTAERDKLNNMYQEVIAF